MAKKHKNQKTSKKNTSKSGKTIPKKQLKQAGFSSNDWKYLIGILVLTIAVFGMSLGNDFVNYDDLKHITTNPIVQGLTAENVITMFTEPINSAYRPLSFLSFAILYKFFGANPFYFHLLSLIVHLVNVYLVYKLILLWTKRTEAAVIVSVLFAIHPLHVESVAWVSTLNDTLYGCFSILALISYTNFLQKGKNSKYILITAIWFLLACFSKPLAIVLPAIFLLMDWYFDDSITKTKTYIQKIPFLLISLLIAYVSVWARNETSSEIDNITNLYGFVDRIFFMFYGIQFYFTKLFMPFGLSAFHAFPLETAGSLPAAYYASPIFTLLIIALIYFAKSFRKILLFGIFFFFINIALVIQLIPFGQTVVAERYTYLSYIGLFYIIAQFYIWIIDGKFSFGKTWGNIMKYTYIALGLFFAVLAYNQTRIWENGLTMFKDAHNQYPYSLPVLSGLGHAYIKYEEDFGSAISVFDDLCTKYPDYTQGFHSRGSAKYEGKDYAGAIEDLTIVIEKTPESVASLHNRSEAYLAIGDYNSTIRDCNAILKIDADYAPSVAQLGHAYFNLKNYNTAINYYNRHLELSPNDINTWYFKGIAHYNNGNSGQACSDWQKAVTLGSPQAPSMLSQYCQ